MMLAQHMNLFRWHDLGEFAQYIQGDDIHVTRIHGAKSRCRHFANAYKQI